MGRIYKRWQVRVGFRGARGNGYMPTCSARCGEEVAFNPIQRRGTPMAATWRWVYSIALGRVLWERAGEDWIGASIVMEQDD